MSFFAFLTRSDAGDDSVIHLQHNHNRPYFGSVQTLSSFSSLVGFMDISKCIDSELLHVTVAMAGEGKH